MNAVAHLGCLALAGALLAGAVRAQDAPRLRVTVNDGWRFAVEPAGDPAAPGYDDAAWEPVTLPHTWNAEDAFDETEGYRRGVGWYRKRLALDPALEGRRLFLHVEGANQVADVWVNGEPAGRHVGGYTAFTLDVTALVRFGAPNVLAVRVDNRHDDAIPPLNADFTFYGGLYRDVWLVATAPVHLDLLDHGGPGVYVDTPEASAEAATVRVRGTVINDGGEPARVAVVSRVLDAAGREVAALRSEMEVPRGAPAPFEHRGALPQPRLWSPADPYLYRVVTEVRDGEAAVDRVESPLGVRWFAVDAERGFSLNGQPLKLVGTNRHQDFPGLGNALPDALHRRDVRIVKDTGFDFLRLAHYPQDPAVLEAADRLGLALWEEIPVVNVITQGEAFAENAERMLVEMIRQHYNHPSVVMWGYMNEVLLRKPDPMPEGYVADVAALARRLDAAAKREDPSRLTALAVSQSEIDDGSGVQDVPDVLGFNLYFGWYGGRMADLGPFLDAFHARHPARPLLISEYGAGSDERVHAADAVAFDFSSEYQQRFHRETLPQLLERGYLVGTGVWNQFDFGSDHRQDTKNAINQKGLFFFDRTPKDVASYYRAMLRDEPVLHLEREHARRAGSRPEDRTQPVRVYTNLDAAELLHDGVSLGTRTPENATAVWTVTFHDGANRFVARSTDGAVADAAEVHYADRTACFADPAAPCELAVNAGGAYGFADPAGVVFEPDRAYAPGGWGHVGGEAKRTHHRILGTSDDPLFQAFRQGAARYRFDVPDGRYELALGFVETEHAAAGQRVFSVAANGQPVATDLDLAGEAGRWAAFIRKAVVDVAGGAGLTVALDASAGVPTLGSLHLRRMR